MNVGTVVTFDLTRAVSWRKLSGKPRFAVYVEIDDEFLSRIESQFGGVIRVDTHTLISIDNTKKFKNLFGCLEVTEGETLSYYALSVNRMR